MKVLDLELDYPGTADWGGSEPSLDLTVCTRCGEPWGFSFVERVEMWSCDYCGYEAREKSADYWRMLVVEQEAQSG